MQRKCFGFSESLIFFEEITLFSVSGITNALPIPIPPDAERPKFKECARHPHIDEAGYVLYYTSQCPFNAKYVPIVEQTAREHNIDFKAIHIEDKEAAQNAPTPVTTYALFYNGEYLTNEQMNDTKFLKLAGLI